MGYHEPEYYHVEISGGNYKTTVFEPNKESFGDFTIDLKVLVGCVQNRPGRRFSLWSGVPPLRGPILCLHDFSAGKKMVCAQEFSE